MITELSLENFRGFRSLELKGLKRVNLIVGHNNAGKTSLLEGIFAGSVPNRFGELPGLFRPPQGNTDSRYFRWLLRDGAPQDVGRLVVRAENGKNILLLSGSADAQRKRPEVAHLREPRLGPGDLQSLHGGTRLKVLVNKDTVSLQCRAISMYGRTPQSLIELVGKAYRKKGGEETMQQLLARVDPRIQKVRIDPGEQQEGNQLIVDIGLSELVPISQVGQGVYRLTAILGDIIGESPEVVLIDEIETGLHHSIHEQIWKGLAETAAELNVQIFATTHSDECLRAAHRAFSSRKEYDFGVIQLFRVESGVQGRLLDQKHIEAALAGDIELRD
jgi:ABC-type molybdenum transport system ATPase subunit/photorepair protein PhrA